MPRATSFENTQNVAQHADQQRADFRSWNAQQQKLIEGQAEEKPLLIEGQPEEAPLMLEGPKALVETRPNVPPPPVPAEPTQLSAPEVKDSVREWEQGQGVVAGAETQANLAQQNNNELLEALPTHVMSPTPLQPRRETFQDRDVRKGEDHHGLKNRITGVAEGVKDRVEGIWEGAKHRTEDLKDKALGVLHLQNNKRQEKSNNQGMISDAEAVRIGKKFDISDDKDTLIERKHHLLGDVKSFVSHKWHELTNAEGLSEEEREEIFRNARETPEWQEFKQEFEHIDDRELRQSLMSRAFFEERRNIQLPPSPLEAPIRRREFVEAREMSSLPGFERPLSPREEPVLFRRPEGRENILYEPIGFQQRSVGEEIRARLDDEGHLIRDTQWIDGRERDLKSGDLHTHSKYDKNYHLPEAEHERLRLARRRAEDSGEGLIGGMKHFVQDKWSALMHPDERTRTPPKLHNSDLPRYEERRDVSPVRETLRRAENETMDSFRHAREDLRKGWYDTKEDIKDAKHWTAAKTRHAREDIKEDWQELKGWAKDAAHQAERKAERIWHKTEDAADRTMAGVEHALGVDQTGPDVVQKLAMMDQENILDMESDKRVYGGAYWDRRFEEPNKSTSWWFNRRQARTPLFGSAEAEKFDVVLPRPELEIERDEMRGGWHEVPEKEGHFWHRGATHTGFVEQPKERAPKAEKHWFWRSRSRSPSPARRRMDDLEANVVEDIVAGAPVQRVSGEFKDSLHQNRAFTEIPIHEERRFESRERREDIPVQRGGFGVLSSMRDFVSDKWNSFTGHHEPEEKKFEAMMPPSRQGMSRFERFENDVADRVELYEDKQIKKAHKDWDEGKISKAHGHASRAHAAESFAEKLRGTDDKENRSPTTPITPGYPV